MADPSTNLTRSSETVEDILRNKMSAPEAWQSCEVSGPVFSTVASQIFQCYQTPGKQPVAIKCTSTGDSREQFEALKKTAAALQGLDHCSSPEPIALIESEGVLVMDWIDGKSLQGLCLSLKTLRREITHAITLSAQIMSGLHRNAQTKPRVLDTADFLNDIDLAFAGAQPPQVILPMLTHLEETAALVASLDLPVAVLHGDFKSANLLIEGKTIFTIDAAMKWEGATVHDAAHFLNQFALDLYHPKAWALRPGLKAFENLFLTTCEDAGNALSPDALQWLRLQKLIVLYAEHYDRRTLASRYLSGCLKFEMRRIYRSFPESVVYAS